ncbi:hypothetical protein NP493_310g02024 [Ridgeia piscesae]|uniref:MULE transposase domain-containing protein n=1 Tax=Ridgeia piscesae TaxID=27915 RepID=A0AAD9NW36_RIDPI|nr:hypothetical protein NP493_310g02024 [Ridgeia piscesae]
MLVFVTGDGLRHFANSDTWHTNGTFNSAPLLFNQLYLIRCPVGESSVSCVYAFLSNKLQSTYEELLTSVLDRCTVLGLQPDPTTVITDYELAAINAVRANLDPQMTGRVCLPHDTKYVEKDPPFGTSWQEP